MSQTEQLRELLSEKSEKLYDDLAYQALSEFYEAAKRDGVVKAPKYDLPPIDTIGRLFGTVDSF